MKLDIHIKPNSTKGPLIEEQTNGSLVVYVREIASDSKANEALIKLLAKRFGAPKTHITIMRGQTSRHKLIDITPPATCKNKP
jgi:uncharacterized protein YggU (UPF0235/DUF167 family)